MNSDRTFGPFKDGTGQELTVRLHHRGIWKIDKIPGKAIMVIILRNPKTNERADYAPKHDEVCEGILDAMLQAELDNDLFLFHNGVAGKQRPTEIFRKIGRVQKKLNEWEQKAIRNGLTKEVA
jgi:hypothetical protein